MNKDNKFFEDLTKLAGSAMDTAFSTAADMKTNFDTMIHNKFNEFVQKQDLVTREEFEIVRQMAQKARTEQAKLEKKLALLEKDFKVKNDNS